MLKKFDKECKKILSKRNLKIESNGFSNADELLEEVFDIRGFQNFNEFKKDQELINKIKITDKNVLKETIDSLWNDNIEKIDINSDLNKESYEFYIQLYNFLKEIY